MKLTLLRFFARRPLTLLALGAAAVLGTGAATVVRLSGRAPAADERSASQGADPSAPADDASDLDPRKILGRGWYDSWPEKRTDVLKFYYFGGGGYGIYEEGSAYRYAVDAFELERQKDKLWIKFLHDGQAVETRFTVSRCDDKPPFDLCLDIPGSPRGPKRYYSFDYDDDSADRFPRGAEMVQRARTQTSSR